MKINWKKGSSTVVVYIAFMWLIVLAAVLFIEYFNMFTHIGKTQLYADLVADGSAFIGNTGWGLDKDEAKDAKRSLVSYNDTFFEDTGVSIGFKKNGEGATADDTVKATAKLDTTMVTEDTAISKDKIAETQITYSGGMRIVLEAWKHTYNFFHSASGQTYYVWGGGHGSDTGWEQYADCSGFVSGVFRKCGYNVPNWACTWNMESMGTLVGTGTGALEKAHPGDIILYWYDLGATSAHVGIYAGKYNGVHYQVHCSGGRTNTLPDNAGSGPNHGAILARVNTGAAKIMVRRIVNSDAKAFETPEPVVPGLTKNQSLIYFTLSSFGFRDVTIAGIMGNFAAEGLSSPMIREGHTSETDPWNTSYDQALRNNRIARIAFIKEGMDTFRYTPDGGSPQPRSEGYGIAQWTTVNITNPESDRKAKLWDYCNGRVYDLMLQTSFAAYELENCNIWSQICASAAPDKYKNATYADFKNCNDPEEAARMFFTHFEGVWDGTDGRRAAYAKQIYNAISSYH